MEELKDSEEEDKEEDKEGDKEVQGEVRDLMMMDLLMCKEVEE